jgi:hypothetical protein
MPEYTALVCSVSLERFLDILAAAPRQAREIYFHRHGIRIPKARGMPKAGAKNAVRGAQLYECLHHHTDEELAQELLRVWLLSKRPMLACALDHLGIAHNNGLTDSDDVAKFAELKGKAAQDLLAKLAAVSSHEDAALYLRFMGAEV